MNEVLVLPDTQNEPWHRQQGESYQAFHGLNLYRNLPPPRTIRAAAELQSESSRRNVATVYSQFRTWSQRHDWQARVDAFDNYLDRVRLLARETERQRIDREQMLEGRYLRSAAITRFTGGTDQNGNPIAPIDWNDLNANQTMAAYKIGVATERQAAGLQVGASLGMVPMAHLRQIAEEIFLAAMDFVPDERKPAFVAKVQTIGESRPG